MSILSQGTSLSIFVNSCNIDRTHPHCSHPHNCIFGEFSFTFLHSLIQKTFRVDVSLHFTLAFTPHILEPCAPKNVVSK